jgi:hypothetical protein
LSNNLVQDLILNLKTKHAANMLLTELLTDKRGPLAKIWMSAHQEKKLSKRDAMGIDIEESVGTFISHYRMTIC